MRLALLFRPISFASLCGAALLLVAGGSEAAVVRGVRAIHADGETRIIVETGGELRYRIHASDDGRSVLADIEESTAEDGVPRMLPVADARVDGVIVLVDESSHMVRISVDVAGRIPPRLEASADASHLILSFVDASQPPNPATARAAGASRAMSGASDASMSGSTSSRPRAGTSNGNPPASRASRAAAASDATRLATEPAAPLLARSVHSAPSVPSVMEKPVVVLDPGHGGKDPGASAWTGEYEKDIVLDVAERVARRLRSRGDIDVVMTRSGDEFVELADRRDTSRRWNADVFVSIHANASKSAAARGFETYYRTRSLDSPAANAPADRLVRRLARLENDGQSVRGRSAAKVSRASLRGSALPVADHGEESARLATLVQSELVRQLDLRYEAVRDLGAREGPFFVIGNNAAPSVLVEAAFLTHREEGLRMRSEVYREQIADGVARGIRLFLEEQRSGAASSDNGAAGKPGVL
ncbi:MAG TPA: N-acetylmuramoyl-L-alanine amidase [Candidatus Limnocylindrales bacterium]|nr:N-acetylmuramoyl-L-alanine amidase [Candidatus Limnocylindrales bacterium]